MKAEQAGVLNEYGAAPIMAAWIQPFHCVVSFGVTASFCFNNSPEKIGIAQDHPDAEEEISYGVGRNCISQAIFTDYKPLIRKRA
jgi:hypothetical protein